MNLPRFVFASCLCIAVSAITPLPAQSNAAATNTPPRRAPRPAPLVSPDLLPGGGVAFRLKAPQAKEVKVVGQFGPDTPLQKDDQGVWSVTLPSVPPGVHEYRFVVDGLSRLVPCLA